MKNKTIRVLAILATSAMVFGLMLVNPFTVIKVNATAPPPPAQVFLDQETLEQMVPQILKPVVFENYTPPLPYTEAVESLLDQIPFPQTPTATPESPTLEEATPETTGYENETDEAAVKTIVTDETRVNIEGVKGERRNINTDDVSDRWFIVFGFSTVAFAGVVLKKDKK